LQSTGFGIIDMEGKRLVYVASGCVKSGAGDLAQRLKAILEGLNEVIAAHGPVEVAVEKVFVNANPQSTLALGQARGTAICAAVLANLPVAEYTALQVKQSVVGNGHAAQGAGAAHGEAPARAAGDPRRTRPMRSLCDLPRAWPKLRGLGHKSFRMKRGRLV
jgi:crossover junction endodeoxyribonuclease RuvC